MRKALNKMAGLACGLLAASLSLHTWAIGNGVYTITSKHSGKMVEVGGASADDGANVNQWSGNGHDTQKWLITGTGNGYYSLINLSSGKAMEVYNFDTNDGGNITQWEYWGGNTQQWSITDRGNGYYSFINRHSGKSLDLLGFDTNDGANIGQWSYWGADAQLWSLQQVGSIESAPWDPSTTNGATSHWPLTGSIVTHDPTIGYDNNLWWIFQTGPGIYGKWSTDGIAWNDAAPIFPSPLSWWTDYVPGNTNNDVWAPDLKRYNGRAWLYYSISTFGSRVSAIGLTSASSVGAGDWRDDGLVVNTTNADDHNAIDPDLIVDKDGAPWLTYGSWNSGIKVKRINPITMKPYGPLYSIAARSGGIEAPTIIYRQGYYYLFTSIGKCCNGADSTYQIMYGRATDIRGPYLDKNGNDLLHGGGEILDSGNSDWAGPGGQDILNTDVIARHMYDKNNNGTPVLFISTLNWDANGWPRY
ncbi:arabinan endo-1 5-alpha-L-arabinosidase (plasmid) [Saccharobesus litoralis]|uniref:Arabinan endo-1 5-alpha-L-arabinosidase n=1 Tax=Saccharobesus litoralis TaxID=2172099 RepID=A0A2S0VYB1_9ALTE|nr:family 43 glycosylhydrolase [Saccharobesus litoralis]AWB69162.1 arabinan endo-1 5-alpha-L-arabinosidase [Saccharobesus litoralis]